MRRKDRGTESTRAASVSGYAGRSRSTAVGAFRIEPPAGARRRDRDQPSASCVHRRC